MRERVREVGFGGFSAARLVADVATVIPHANETTVRFSTLEFRTGSGIIVRHDSTVNAAGRLIWPNVDGFVIQQPGWYVISASVIFPTNTAGRRQLILLDGSVRLAHTEAHPGNNADTVAASTVAFLPIGRIVHVNIYQNSGGDLNVNPYNRTTHLAIARVG